MGAGSHNAMRPAPFKDSYEHTSPSGARLVSTRSGDHMSTEGETSVFGTDGKLLYTMNSFTGRQEVFLSADGKVLVLDGGQYFGSGFLRPSRMEPDEVVSTIYLNG